MATTLLDADQVIKMVYDEPTQSLNTNATLVASEITIVVDIQEDEDSIQIYGNDGSTNRAIKTDSDGNLQVDVLSSALPSGAATESKQDVGNTSLSSIDTKLTTTNNILTNIDSDIDTTLSSRASETTLSAINNKLVSGTDIGDVTVNNGSGAGAVNIQDGGNSITVDGTITALQGTSPWVVSGTVITSPDVNVHDGSGNSINSTSNSLHVNVTNIVPVSQSGSWTVAGIGNFTVVQPTGSNLHTVLDSGVLTSITNSVHVDDNGGSLTVDNNGTFAVQAAQSGTWNINNISGTISLPTDAATETTLSALNAKFNSLGQKTSANSAPVVIASDQTTIPTSIDSAGTVGDPAPTKAVQIAGPDGSGNLRAATVKTLATIPIGTDFGMTTNTLMYGLTTGGGGGYVPVKVNPSGTITADVTGTVTANQGGTWNINNISGTISLPTGAATSALQTQPGVDIGDVTVNNAAGASAVNIQDGGNSITVDGSVTVTQATGTNLHTVIDSGTITTVSTVTNLVQLNGAAISMNTGVRDAGTQRVTIATNDIVPVSQSGTWTVQQGTPPWSIVGNVASAATDSGNPVKTGAIFNTTLPTVTNGQRVDSQSDANGRHIVVAVPSDGYKATYSATGTFTAANTATDIFTLTGSASKTIRISRIGITATRTTQAMTDIILLKRSTANTGGTSTTLTNVSLDSTNAAATATARSYTANPTTGTLVGNLRNIKTVVPVIAIGANTASQNELVEFFGDKHGQALVLRGTGEVFSVNLNAVTVAGNIFSIWIEWTED